MKKLSYIVFTLFILLLFNTNIYAKENTVNIYFFHSYTCPHCKSESKLLEELEKTYDNINIYKYEISEANNTELLSQVGELFNTKITGVPFTVIGKKTIYLPSFLIFSFNTCSIPTAESTTLLIFSYLSNFSSLSFSSLISSIENFKSSISFSKL